MARIRLTEDELRRFPQLRHHPDVILPGEEPPRRRPGPSGGTRKPGKRQRRIGFRDHAFILPGEWAGVVRLVSNPPANPDPGRSHGPLATQHPLPV
ncbi:MAG TPA: hypothetical protein VGH33_02445 [Isosphaeraceae bacterium]|jgi:hypothetical protein